MHFRETTALFGGLESTHHWGQACHRPGVFIVVEVKTDDEQAVIHGQQVLVTLEERLSQKNIETPEALQEILIHAGSLASGIAIVAGVSHKEKLLVAQTGRGSVVLVREDLVAVLLKEKGSVSGVLKDADTILLGSETLFTTLSVSKLVQLLKTNTLESTGEECVVMLHQLPDQGMGAAGLLVRFHIDSSQEEEEVVVEKKPSELKKSLENRFDSFRTHLAHHDFSRKRLIVALICMVLGVVGLLGLFTIQKQKAVNSSRAFNDVVSLTTHQFEEGMALLDLNIVRSRELLTEAHDGLEKYAHDHRLTREQKQQFNELSEKITQGLVVASRSYTAEPSLFLDLTILKDGATGISLSLFQDTATILDRVNRALYNVFLTQKTAAIAGGGENLRDSITVGNHGAVSYVVTGNGIMRFGKNEAKGVKIAEKDEHWGTLVDMGAYGGNVYVLDKTNSQLWKYIATETGFSDIRKYLAPDVFPDFTHATSLAIDGSLWISVNGTVLKFTNGVPESFTFSGLTDTLSDDLLVYTDDTLEHLYVFDRSKKRLVVTTKEGMYRAEYVWNNALQIDDFVVSEMARTVLILSGSALYKIELQ